MAEHLHKHCWHVTSSYTNGLGSAGASTEVCCHCGEVTEVPWEAVTDTNHGRFYTVRGKMFGARRTLAGAYKADAHA